MKNVISYGNLPTRSPFLLTLVLLLAFDVWKAPEWAWGMGILILICCWFGYFFMKGGEEEVDIVAKVYPPKTK